MNAVITGATKGIGRAIATKLAAAGYNLAVCSRSGGDLLALKRELKYHHSGIRVFFSPVDVSEKEQVDEFAAMVKEEMGSVDVLVNNVGVFFPIGVLDAKDGDLEQFINTNLYSAYWLTRALVPTMIAKKSGYIFNICSVSALQVNPAIGAYSVSKHALYAFSRSLREELKTDGVKVCHVHPGQTYTASWDGIYIDPQRLIPPEDVAEAVYGILQLSDRTVVEEIVLRPQLGDL